MTLASELRLTQAEAMTITQPCAICRMLPPADQLTLRQGAIWCISCAARREQIERRALGRNRFTRIKYKEIEPWMVDPLPQALRYPRWLRVEHEDDNRHIVTVVEHATFFEQRCYVLSRTLLHQRSFAGKPEGRLRLIQLQPMVGLTPVRWYSFSSAYQRFPPLLDKIKMTHDETRTLERQILYGLERELALAKL